MIRKKENSGNSKQFPQLLFLMNSFRYVISRNQTPAVKAYIKHSEKRDHVEVTPESLITIKTVASKLESYGGLSLIADYGHGGEGTDTFRAFKDHKLHDPLIQPGSADLTADVDFGRLKEVKEVMFVVFWKQLYSI